MVGRGHRASVPSADFGDKPPELIGAVTFVRDSDFRLADKTAAAQSAPEDDAPIGLTVPRHIIFGVNYASLIFPNSSVTLFSAASAWRVCRARFPTTGRTVANVRPRDWSRPCQITAEIERSQRIAKLIRSAYPQSRCAPPD